MTKMRHYNIKSNVEKIFLSKSGHPFRYPPQEKLNVIEVEDFSTLGKLTALRFIEWLQLNPQGVISLPTGKTPDLFIKWTSFFLQNWSDQKVQEELSSFGLSSTKPDLNSYSFVQIDEFFPIDPKNENSFAFYINKFYFKEFGLDPKKALLMDLSKHIPFESFDPSTKLGTTANGSLANVFPNGKVDLSLRFRNPENNLEQARQKIIFAVDQFCTEYEQKILDLGGIGFFLGGIGPDGHIAFDIKGSDHFSTTRLSCINYQTAAACADSFGGIEFARNKTVTTVGLKTIVQNPTTTAIIIASGQGKAKVVKDAVENEPLNLYPATVLQKLETSCFYITKDSASLLVERQYQNLKKLPKTDSLKIKIQNGLKDLSGKTFLHTGPHHDDIMLGYLSYIINLTKNPENKHYFAIMTSGFNSVNNAYMQELTKQVKTFFEQSSEQLFSDLQNNTPTNRDQDVFSTLKAIAQNNPEKRKELENLRFLRNLIESFAIDLKEKEDLTKIKAELEKLNIYFQNNSTSTKDSPEIQKLKGKIREWEEELLWGHFGFDHNNIFHKRLGFYSSKASQPEFERDVKPILELLEKIKPDVLTVTIDPMGSGPDTHYKVLQAIRAATKEYLKNNKDRKLEIWGYRNVWYKFLPTDANIFVPVDLNSLSILRNTFLTCYASQRKAAFPSHEYDGPFCDLVQKIMVDQFEVIKNCLGKEFFSKSDDNRLRATQALCFLKAMTPEEFLETSSY